MMEFGVLCCLTTPGLRKDIRRQIQQLYSHQVIYYVLLLITYYRHFCDHVLTYTSISDLFILSYPGLFL